MVFHPLVHSQSAHIFGVESIQSQELGPFLWVSMPVQAPKALGRLKVLSQHTANELNGECSIWDMSQFQYGILALSKWGFNH